MQRERTMEGMLVLPESVESFNDESESLLYCKGIMLVDAGGTSEREREQYGPRTHQISKRRRRRWMTMSRRASITDSSVVSR